MKNLYLITLNDNTHVLIVASSKSIAEYYCLQIVSYCQYIKTVELIGGIGGDHEEGEILKKF
jgi:hypothetical protein